MTEDWLVEKIEAVERAADVARTALADVAAVLEPARTARVSGVPLAQIAQDMTTSGAEPRRVTAAALREYEHCVADLRAAVLRALVDDEGVPLSAIARAMGISRQAATRLYQDHRHGEAHDG